MVKEKIEIICWNFISLNYVYVDWKYIKFIVNKIFFWVFIIMKICGMFKYLVGVVESYYVEFVIIYCCGKIM